jgi:transcription antitermination factor NusG
MGGRDGDVPPEVPGSAVQPGKPARVIKHTCQAVVRDWPPGMADHLDPDADWIVTHCRPRQERQVERDMQRLGIAGLAFFERRVRRYPGKGVQEGLVPLLGGYTFLVAGMDHLAAIRETGRIVNFITPPDPRRLVVELADLIRLVRASTGPVVMRPELVAGQTVEIQDGPFAGCRGIIRRRANARELVVNIELLGQSAAVQLPAAAIASP